MFNNYVEYYVSFNVCSSSHANVNAYTWHARLCHIGQDKMNRIIKVGLLGSLSKIDLSYYEHFLADNGLLPNESSKAQVDELLFDSSARDLDHNDSSGPNGSNLNRNNPDHDDSYDLSKSNPNHIDSSDPQLQESNRKGMLKHHYEIEGHTYIISSIDEVEPKNIDEALSCPSRDKWINTMEEEMELMKSNNVWELVEIPHGHKAIGNKWVLNIK
ncbi:uncharacterized protein LOC121990908 [Zingiber officinale]|uniref:uncharacterized protein LOC121990908 n=1 Tax=Zingiber officinale TaxID=94328 RepID=UPI001C4B5596|nr:uncharacterized protein LOC121990908 [Zingiber officinale]